MENNSTSITNETAVSETQNTDVTTETTESVSFSDSDENETGENTTDTPKKTADKEQPDEADEADEPDKQKSTKKQSREENRKYAEMRREKERQEKERQEIEKKAYRKGLIEAINGINPYTNKKIDDDYDIDEYLTMREIEKEGLDPIADYSSYLKKKSRVEASMSTSKNVSKEWLENDAKNFMKKYPDINLESLLEDKIFVKFADGKLGNQSLAKVYEDYSELIENFNSETDKKVRLAVARSKSSPGSVETGKPTEDSKYFSWEQLQKMSNKEMDKNYDKVVKSYNYHLKKGINKK